MATPRARIIGVTHDERGNYKKGWRAALAEHEREQARARERARHNERQRIQNRDEKARRLWTEAATVDDDTATAMGWIKDALHRTSVEATLPCTYNGVAWPIFTSDTADAAEARQFLCSACPIGADSCVFFGELIPADED